MTKCCSLDIQHASCEVWWQTLSSDCSQTLSSGCCITWSLDIYHVSWWQTQLSDKCMIWSVVDLIYITSAEMFDDKRYHLRLVLPWSVAGLIYSTSAVMFDGKRYHQTSVLLEYCSLDIHQISCEVRWQTLSSDCCMTWSVAVLKYNTSTVMCDGKRYHQTELWLDVLQSWYTTRQPLYLMENTSISLVYYLKFGSLDIEHVSCEFWWQTLSSDQCITWSDAVLMYNTSAVMFDGTRYQQSSVLLEVLQSFLQHVSCYVFMANAHQTEIWLDVLQSWYTTLQPLYLLS